MLELHFEFELIKGEGELVSCGEPGTAERFAVAFMMKAVRASREDEMYLVLSEGFSKENMKERASIAKQICVRRHGWKSRKAFSSVKTLSFGERLVIVAQVSFPVHKILQKVQKVRPALPAL